MVRGIFRSKRGKKDDKLLPFRGCARYTSVAEQPQQTLLAVPLLLLLLLLLCQTVPDPSYSEPLRSLTCLPTWTH